MRAYFRKNVPVDKNFRGQGQLIMSKISNEETGAKTTVQLALLVKDELITRQTAERVVAFYMSVWLKKGYVGFVEIAAPDTPTTSEGERSDGSGPASDGSGTKPAVVTEERAMPSLTGKKLGEAVLTVLEFKAKTMSEQEIVELLKQHSYDVNVNQVRTAVQNLARKEAVIRNGDRVSLAA